MMKQRVVVVGGGVIGSASAYFLKSKQPDLQVTVLERDPTYKHASSPLAVGGIRYQFSNKENVEICRYSSLFLQQISQHLAVQPGEFVDINYHQNSYMFLVGDAPNAAMGGATVSAVVSENLATQRACGCPTEFISSDKLKETFPWLNLDGISGGTITPVGAGEGWFDPASLLNAFKRKAISLGVTYQKAQMTSVDTANNSIKTEDGAVLPYDQLVMSVGRHSGYYAKLFGVENFIQVHPRKRYVHMIACPNFDVVRSQAFLKGAPQTRPMPMTIDTSGVFVRPEGDGFLVGTSPHGDDPDPDAGFEDFNVGEDANTQFMDLIWPALATRIPAFETAKLRSTWAGHYDFNTVDHNALIGRINQPNVVWATGFSGHGLMQAPAVGRAVSELIIDGKFTTIDLTKLSAARTSPVIEKNVI
eukprot:PhF_6_TR39089/c0_g1_i2/m.58502/K18166/FOXRED1; FAD-dependent oxidoreductase domain-containing protein 1